MSIENFTQQNAFNDKIFEVLQNHFTYEEDSRKMIADTAALLADTTKTLANLSSKMTARQTRLGIIVTVVSIIGAKKIYDLEKRVKKLEEE